MSKNDYLESQRTQPLRKALNKVKSIKETRRTIQALKGPKRALLLLIILKIVQTSKISNKHCSPGCLTCDSTHHRQSHDRLLQENKKLIKNQQKKQKSASPKNEPIFDKKGLEYVREEKPKSKCYSCAKGYKFQNFECQKCALDNCASCLKDVMVCEACKEQFFLGKLEKDLKYCFSCPPYCQKCTGTDKCESCYWGYDFKEDQKTCSISSTLVVYACVVIFVVTLVIFTLAKLCVRKQKRKLLRLREAHLKLKRKNLRHKTRKKTMLTKKRLQTLKSDRSLEEDKTDPNAGAVKKVKAERRDSVIG